MIWVFGPVYSAVLYDNLDIFKYGTGSYLVFSGFILSHTHTDSTTGGPKTKLP